ncbi:serine hydrolase domain-containing protein [Sphingomonas sp. ERG5]|uniref:serine hydrolase domain-containing protein n=1 Tax=Sphingomonas sp. ERG5 TaxID=1381597 RepID=UPI0009DF0F50|nr:serine hydrolase domain-containing protein [Sphingomonas sp. ERG5]
MLRRITTLCALAALCIAASAIAAPDPGSFEKRLDTFVQSEMQAEKVPGIAIAVLRKGEIVVAKGYGLATVEHDIPVTPDTIFQSGSVGKMFTAAAVMSQVERGKMGLDDPVSKYLPDAPATWRTMTIRHLLTHTSGVANYGPDFDYRRDYSDDELVKVAYALPLDFKPGARWSYSNTGYVLLGILVKKATGQSYLEVLDAQVFKPLGMKTARGISDADIVPHRASGYHLVNGVLKNQDWVSPSLNTTADGSLYFSLNDVIAWVRGIEQGKVLTAASWQQIYTPVKLNSGKPYPYGFAWRIETAGGQPRYHHGGAWQGFRTYVSRYLGDDLSIILLSNSADTKLDTFVDGIAGLWDPALTARGPRPAAQPAIERRVSALVEKARAGALTQQDLPLAAVGFPAMANRYFASILKKLGTVTKLELSDRRELGDDTLYTYVATFGDRAATVSLGIASDGQVSSFMINN